MQDGDGKTRWTTRRRVLVGMGLGLVVAIGGWFAWSWLVIFHPTTDQPAHADAVVVLGPWLDDRYAQAVDTAKQFGIDQIVLSVGDTGGQRTPEFCKGLQAEAGETIDVTCFIPVPYNTEGEAREIGTLAVQRRWASVAVIVPSPQLSRARTLIGRCFAGKLLMIPTPNSSGFDVYELLHQSGAYLKAAILASC